MKNFYKIISGVDVSGAMLQIHQSPHLWDKNNLRTRHSGTAHSEVSDIWLRFNEIPEDPNIVIDDKVCVNYPALFEIPSSQDLILSLMHKVRGESLGRCLITKLSPGSKIYPHEDMGAPAEYFERYHIALSVMPGVQFRCGDEYADMRTGDVWWFNNQIEHEVINNSSEDRVTMIIDIRSMK